MPITLRVAVTLAAALAFSAPLQATDKNASDQVVSNEIKAEPQPENQSQSQGQSDANTAPQTEAKPVVEDPLTIAMKAKLAAVPPGSNSRDKAERGALSDYYTAREYRPVWVTPAGLFAPA